MRETALKLLARKRMLQTALIVLVGAFVAAGIVNDDIQDVVSNATLLCFSCIGLK